VPAAVLLLWLLLLGRGRRLLLGLRQLLRLGQQRQRLGQQQR